MNLVLVTLALLICGVFSQASYTKYAIENDPNAKCLDGSSPIVYLHQGSDPNNILIFLMGSGLCSSSTLEESIQNCYNRSLTLWGSSKNWPSSYTFSGYGMLDKNITTNKFANWSKVIVIGCDGGAFQGNNLNPVPAKNGSSLYFRGSVNMRATFEWANSKLNFTSAKKIVLAGTSSGGVGVFLWIDYLKTLVSDKSKVYGIADSAMYTNPDERKQFVNKAIVVLDYVIPPKDPSQSTPITPKQTVGDSPLTQFFSMSNADERPPNTNCINSISDRKQDWKCLYITYAMNYLETKLLWVQSQYDLVVAQKILGLTCVEESNAAYSLSSCKNYQLLLLDLSRAKIYYSILLKLFDAGHSIWSIACAWSSGIDDSYLYYSTSVRAPYTGARYTMKQAVQAFVFQNQSILKVDPAPWPSNTQCAY